MVKIARRKYIFFKLMLAITLCFASVDYNVLAMEENVQPTDKTEIIPTEEVENSLETLPLPTDNNQDLIKTTVLVEEEQNINLSMEVALSDKKDISDLLSLGNHYVISDENIVKVVDGKIEALALGNATVSIYQDDQLLKQLDITVISDEATNVPETLPSEINEQTLDETLQAEESSSPDKNSETVSIALFAVNLNNLKESTDVTKVYASTTSNDNHFSIYLNKDESIDFNDAITVYVLSDSGQVLARGEGSYNEYYNSISVNNLFNTQEIVAGIYDVKVVCGDNTLVKKEYVEYTDKVIIDGVYIAEEKNEILLKISFNGSISQDVLQDLKVNFIQDGQVVSSYDDLSKVIMSSYDFKLNIDLSKVDKNKVLNIEILSKSDASKYVLACGEITSEPGNIPTDWQELYDANLVDPINSIFELSFSKDLIGKEIEIEVYADNNSNSIIDRKKVTIDQNGKANFELLVQNKKVNIGDLVAIYNYNTLHFNKSDDPSYYGVEVSLNEYGYTNQEVIVLPESKMIDENTFDFKALIPNGLSLLGSANDLTITCYEGCQISKLEKDQISEGYKISAQIVFSNPQKNNSFNFTISSKENNVSYDVYVNLYTYFDVNGNKETFSTFNDHIYVYLYNEIDKLEILNENSEVIYTNDKLLIGNNVLNVSNLFKDKAYYTFRVSKYGQNVSEKKLQYIDDEFLGDFSVRLDEIEKNTLFFNYHIYSFFQGSGRIGLNWLKNYFTKIQLINANDESISLAETITNISYDLQNEKIVLELSKSVPNVRYRLYDYNNELINNYYPENDIFVSQNANKYFFEGVEDQSIRCNIIKNNKLLRYDVSVIKEGNYYVLDSEAVADLEKGKYDVDFYVDGIIINISKNTQLMF